MHKQNIYKVNILLPLIDVFIVYCVCTFLYAYDNFAIKAAMSLFIIILIGKEVDNRSFIQKNILLFFLWGGIYVFFQFVKSDYSHLTVLASFWYIIVSVIIFEYLSNIKNNNLRLVQLSILVSCIATIIILNLYPLAARAIGGVGAGSEDVNQLVKMGCGGYGYIYGLVPISYALVEWLINDAKKRFSMQKVFMIFLLVVVDLTIIKSNFTTALLVTVLGSLYALLIREKRYWTIVVAGVLLLFVAFNLNSILISIKNIAINANMTLLSHKMDLLLSAQSSGDASSMARYIVFQKSIAAFLSNPILGSTDLGGHSFVFDTIGLCGIAGFVIVFGVINLFKQFRLVLEKKVIWGLTTIFVLLATFDTFSACNQIVMSFLVAPMIILNGKKQDKSFEDVVL